MSLNRRIDKKNAVHLHYGVLLRFLKDDLIKLSVKWIEPDKTILSEVPIPRKINVVYMIYCLQGK